MADSTTRGICLGRQWADLPSAVWAFFKTPIHSGQLFGWLDQVFPDDVRMPPAAARTPPLALPAVAPAPIPPDTQWRGQCLQLSRWPNLSQYGNSVQLAISCGRLLAGPTPYAQLFGSDGTLPEGMSRLLADCSVKGWLSVSDPTPTEASTSDAHVAPSAWGGAPLPTPSLRQAMAAPAPAPPAAAPSARTLLTRLLRKFR